jgi:hypothetical protein
VPPRLRHVFACLVHERVDCIVDLIRNLRFFDPDSPVLLYDGSGGSLLKHAATFEGLGAVVHPRPRSQSWGRLHDSVFDCLELGRERFAFDALTVVDSDQLLVGRGYVAAVAAALEQDPAIGLLGTPNPSVGEPWATANEERERKLWQPFLERFPGGLEQQYPANWIFWPGTVFTGEAAAALCELRGDPMLAEIMQGSSFTSEEMGFPTTAAALGFKVAPKPWSDVLRWRRRIRAQEVEAALANPDCFWLHPVRRNLDDPARALLRHASNDYEGFTPTLSRAAAADRPPAVARVKRRAANGLFRMLAMPVDGLAAKQARAAIARARRTQT